MVPGLCTFPASLGAGDSFCPDTGELRCHVAGVSPPHSQEAGTHIRGASTAVAARRAGVRITDHDSGWDRVWPRRLDDLPTSTVYQRWYFARYERGRFALAGA